MMKCLRRFLSHIPLPTTTIPRSTTTTIPSSTITTTPSPTISVTPNPALVDESLTIRVSHLTPHEEVSIRCDVDVEGKRFESAAWFRADAGGVVDVRHHCSLRGSYVGLQPMGLITHMLPSPGQRPGTRLLQRDVSKPLMFNMTVHPASDPPGPAGDPHYPIVPTSDSRDPGLCSVVVERSYCHPHVTKCPVREGRLRGTLFLPPGPGPHPGVIDLFGTMGGLVEFRSALLASRGFATLALAYFAYDDLPPELGVVELSYFEEALRWMLCQACVMPHGIGLVGVSKGAELVMDMATHFPGYVGAAVAINGLYTYWLTSWRGQELDSDLPYPPSPMREEGGVFTLDTDAVDPAAFSPEVRGVVPVERATCPLMYIVGEDDKSLASVLTARQSYGRLESRGLSNYTLLSYPGAGHLIEPPYSPLCAAGYHPALGALMAFGGEADAHARAQEDAWRKMTAFLNTHIRDTYHGQKSKL